MIVGRIRLLTSSAAKASAGARVSHPRFPAPTQHAGGAPALRPGGQAWRLADGVSLVVGKLAGIVLVALWLCLTGRADTVSTLGGARHEGKVQFEQGTIVIQSATGVPARVAFTNLLRLEITPPISVTTVAPEPAWRAEALGGVGECSYSEQGGVFSVRCGGKDGFRAKTDGWFFIHRPLEGNGEIVAQVSGLATKQDWSVAGVSLREEAVESTRGVTLVAKGSGSGVLYLREKSKYARIRRVSGLPVPCWFKLTRLGDQVSAYHSADGQKWQLIESAVIPLERKLWAGLVASCRKSGVVSEPQFSHVKISESSHRGPFLPRVVLANGSVLAAPISAADTTAVRCEALGQALSISTINVARLEFQPLEPELATRMRPGRAGVLLANGDFVDGEFKGVADGRVRISSVLFGLRTFTIGREALAVTVREVAPAGGRWELKLANGSVLAANTLVADDGAVVFKDGSLNGLRIPAAELRNLRALSGADSRRP